MFRIQQETKRNTNFLLLICRYCPASIKYRQYNGIFKLVSKNNRHSHNIQSIDDNNKKLVQSAIVNGLHLSNQQNYNNLIQNYPVSKRQFTKFKKGLLSKPDFKLIEELFRSMEYIYKHQFNPQDTSKVGLPDRLVAISPLNKRNYLTYGHFISYDITYNCIIEQSYEGRKYGLGIFSGYDNNNRILIFGFSVTANETVNDFIKIFDWFFEMMGTRNLTTSIITDQQKSLTIALEQLKKSNPTEYKYHNVYDNFHFIHTFRSLVKKIDPEVQKQILNKLKQTMRQHVPILGKKYLLQLIAFLDDMGFTDSTRSILQKYENVCLWAMPNQLFGLSLHSNQKLNDLLKMKVEQEVQLSTFIKIFQELTEQRNKKCVKDCDFENLEVEELFDDQKILEIRILLEKKAFERFTKNYRRSELFKMISHEKESQQTIQIANIHDQTTFKIVNWECQCKFTEKIGIPCQHILFAFREIHPNQSYRSLINTRWISKKRGSGTSKKKRYRRKKIEVLQQRKQRQKQKKRSW